MELRRSSRRSWFFVAALAFTLLVALTWDRLALAFAIAWSERRPQLLSDVDFDRPAPAFARRFGNGTSERELLRWLITNDFKIDGRSRRASPIVHSLPCNERVVVSWTATNGIIRESEAIVSNDGCL